MTTFGGLGGVSGGRKRFTGDEFENAIEKTLGKRLRKDKRTSPDGLGARLWGSLANMVWLHEGGCSASYSFRAAGDLIAAVKRQGDYMTWYMSGEDGTPDPEVVEALVAEGWAPISWDVYEAMEGKG